MTYAEIVGILSAAGIEDASFEAGLLISRFAGVSRASLFADPGRNYSCPGLTEAVEKRASRYPLQYIFGSWEFMGLEFEVNENCLIPRPDTECVTEAALRCLKKGGRVLDLCTGSGCIIAAVLHYSENTAGYAVELYPETVRLAQKNLAELNLSDRCTVITGDACTDLFPETEKFDVIVSNPPYIAREEMSALEPELSYEPRAALTDEGDGLYFYRAIISAYKDHLADGGTMIFEHGWKQSEDIIRFAAEQGMTAKIIKDLGGNIRGCELRKEERIKNK